MLRAIVMVHATQPWLTARLAANVTVMDWPFSMTIPRQESGCHMELNNVWTDGAVSEPCWDEMSAFLAGLGGLPIPAAGHFYVLGVQHAAWVREACTTCQLNAACLMKYIIKVMPSDSPIMSHRDSAVLE